MAVAQAGSIFDVLANEAARRCPRRVGKTPTVVRVNGNNTGVVTIERPKNSGARVVTNAGRGGVDNPSEVGTGFAN